MTRINSKPKPGTTAGPTSASRSLRALTPERCQRDLRTGFVTLQIHILWSERGWLSVFQTDWVLLP